MYSTTVEWVVERSFSKSNMLRFCCCWYICKIKDKTCCDFACFILISLLTGAFNSRCLSLHVFFIFIYESILWPKRHAMKLSVLFIHNIYCELMNALFFSLCLVRCVDCMRLLCSVSKNREKCLTQFRNSRDNLSVNWRKSCRLRHPKVLPYLQTLPSKKQKLCLQIA